MQKFKKYLLLFLLLPLIIVLIDLLSAPNRFTFRQWEALQYNYAYFSFGSFYPHQKITMDEVGDLGRHTPYEVRKNTTWITDEIGFRNDKYIFNPDIVLLGDSFFAGSGLTQDSTVTDLLKDKTGNDKVYNISPNDFPKFDFLLKAGKIQKPKVLVFSVVERSVNELKVFQPQNKFTVRQSINNGIVNIIPYQLPMSIDRMVKLSFLRYLSVKINPVGLAGYFSKEDDKKTREKKMLFLNTSEHRANEKVTVSDKVIQALLSYKSYCDLLGIKFIFVPIPDKETVYYEYISPTNTQSAYLYKLDSALQNHGIVSINTLQVLNGAKKQSPGILLYQYDDTHWNGAAVNIVANEILKRL